MMNKLIKIRLKLVIAKILIKIFEVRRRFMRFSILRSLFLCPNLIEAYSKRNKFLLLLSVMVEVDSTSKIEDYSIILLRISCLTSLKPRTNYELFATFLMMFNIVNKYKTRYRP